MGPNLLGGAGTSDGRTLVFARRSDGLWTSDGAGRDAVRLAADTTFDVRVTPDDRHVVFLSSRGDVEAPWIVPIDGGEPTVIDNVPTSWGSIDISSDGRLLFQSGGALVTCDLPSCENRRELRVPANFGGRSRWTPDGQRIAYIGTRGTNLWTVATDGGPPRQLTRFQENDDRTIEAFAWSHDGQRLATVRTTTTSDIVLIRGLAPGP